MKFPAMEDWGSILYQAAQAFVKEIEEVLEAIAEKLKEIFGQ